MSLHVDLPTYSIITGRDSQGNPFSAWEFIEGVHRKGETAYEVVESRTSPEKERLHRQLHRLESVCNFLNLSDLHEGNILFCNLGEDSSRIVLIDLESIQKNAPSGLFPPSKLPILPKLSPEETFLLEGCKKDLVKIQVRFIPIETSSFLGSLTRCNSFVKMASLVRDEVQRKEHQLLISLEKLEMLILKDFINNDIPYLTEKEGNPYYASQKRCPYCKKEDLKMSVEGANSFLSPHQRPVLQQHQPSIEEIYRFTYQTKRLENDCMEAALKEAESVAAKGIKVRILGTSNSISSEAYLEFKKKMEELFGSSIPRNLVELTLESKERVFLSTLKERVKEILEIGGCS